MPPGQPIPGHGQHMGQPMLHPGASGPNGPHVSQAGPLMPGMHPGVGPGGPSAHALQHLTPGGGNYQQQLQMQQAMAGNPALANMLQGHQQQQQFLQQQQHQRMMQQQAQQQHGQGMPMQFNPAMAQRFAQMQQQSGHPGIPPGVNLTPNLQQQMQHQRMMQQQAQQHQQQQAMANQQQVPMQHAPSQSSNQGAQQQPPNSQPQGPQGQQTPMRPQSRMAGPHEAQNSPAQQSGPPQGQPQPAPVQVNPQQQGQQQPQPQQQQPQQSAQQQPQGPPQQGQQGPQGPQGQPTPQAAQGVAQTNRQMQMMNAMQNRQNQAQRPNGATIMKLLQFANHLGGFRLGPEAPNSMKHWQQFTGAHFSDTGSIDYTCKAMTDDSVKRFEICNASLARYFFSHFEGGVEHIQIMIDGASEKEFPNGMHCVEASRARFFYWYKNKTQIVSSGKMTVVYNQNDLIDRLEFKTESCEQFVPRQVIEEKAQASPNQKQSPRMTKTGKQRPQPKPATPSIALSELPAAPITDWGVASSVQSFLEINETMTRMQELMSFSQQHPDLTPSQSLNRLVANYAANPAPAMTQNGTNVNPAGQMQGQVGGGNMAQNFMNMSPALQNQMLPGQMNGSPHISNVNLNAANLGAAHTPSPAQTHMAAPKMAAQHSQQGTSSTLSNASANTSPNINNKRRRSTVKEEDGEPNGTAKVKASPRIGNNAKRTKG
ncbi:hypothetical protein K402DRAFT_400156 [Aulographum hederae CBS 113979]|uniref:LIM-domain-containing protein n=1 Tax=Aulographum hederae CBS 113979 TaxID=1176131 RepID=A0A6G1HEB5_9PEZI|nr:hypothetical protein K402DRAFT_400156 [Aulographum hederae CBS 113979]